MKSITKRQKDLVEFTMNQIKENYEKFLISDEIIVNILGEEAGEWISEELNNRTYNIDNVLEKCNIKVEE